jgi:hypothetical protein
MHGSSIVLTAWEARPSLRSSTRLQQGNDKSTSSKISKTRAATRQLTDEGEPIFSVKDASKSRSKFPKISMSLVKQKPFQAWIGNQEDQVPPSSQDSTVTSLEGFPEGLMAIQEEGQKARIVVPKGEVDKIIIGTHEDLLHQGGKKVVHVYARFSTGPTWMSAPTKFVQLAMPATGQFKDVVTSNPHLTPPAHPPLYFLGRAMEWVSTEWKVAKFWSLWIWQQGRQGWSFSKTKNRIKYHARY